MEYVAAFIAFIFVAILIFCLAVMVKVFKRNRDINKTSAAMDREYADMLASINNSSRRTRNHFKMN